MDHRRLMHKLRIYHGMVMHVCNQWGMHVHGQLSKEKLESMVLKTTYLDQMLELRSLPTISLPIEYTQHCPLTSMRPIHSKTIIENQKTLKHKINSKPCANVIPIL